MSGTTRISICAKIYNGRVMKAHVAMGLRRCRLAKALQIFPLGMLVDLGVAFLSIGLMRQQVSID
jgi:hypothetical protein